MSNLIVDNVNLKKGLKLPVYTEATKPANPQAGDVIFVQDDNTFQYYDGSEWFSAGGGIFNVSGGTEFTNAGFKYHIFETNDTLTVTGTSDVDLLMVGGGGSGACGSESGGGGGAGGVLVGTYTLTEGSYPIEIGLGGASVSSNVFGNDGGDTTFDGLTAFGGGGGGWQGGSSATNGRDGGSGGGGSGIDSEPATSGGASTQTNQGGLVGYGNIGGGTPTGSGDMGSGGGGATQPGQGGYNGSGSTGYGGDGGDGLNVGALWGDTFILSYGQAGSFAGGGGGGSNYTGAGSGGLGGGGNGGLSAAGSNGLDGSGGGGGGAQGSRAAGKGGDGILIIRYPIQ